MRIQFRIPGFDGQKLENCTDQNSHFWSKIAKYSVYPEAFVKDVQASGKASSPQKENIQDFKTTIF